MQHIEIVNNCPVCVSGKMVRYAENAPGIVARRCNLCGYKAKYQRIEMTRIVSVEVIPKPRT